MSLWRYEPPKYVLVHLNTWRATYLKGSKHEPLKIWAPTIRLVLQVRPFHILNITTVCAFSTEKINRGAVCACLFRTKKRENMRQHVLFRKYLAVGVFSTQVRVFPTENMNWVAVRAFTTEMRTYCWSCLFPQISTELPSQKPLPQKLWNWVHFENVYQSMRAARYQKYLSKILKSQYASQFSSEILNRGGFWECALVDARLKSRCSPAKLFLNCEGNSQTTRFTTLAEPQYATVVNRVVIIICSVLNLIFCGESYFVWWIEFVLYRIVSSVVIRVAK